MPNFFPILYPTFLQKTLNPDSSAGKSYEAAKSRGMDTRNLGDTLKLIASLSVTLFQKALQLSKENSHALKSRGYNG